MNGQDLLLQLIKIFSIFVRTFMVNVLELLYIIRLYQNNIVSKSCFSIVGILK